MMQVTFRDGSEMVVGNRGFWKNGRYYRADVDFLYPGKRIRISTPHYEFWTDKVRTVTWL